MHKIRAMYTHFKLESPKGRNLLGDPDIDRRIILKLTMCK